jgi:DNA-binding transcriptional LysR family regulator
LDEQTERGGADAPRRVTTVYDSQTAISIVACTDLIARVPDRTAAHAADRGRIIVLDTGARKPSASIVMVWHSRQRSAQDLSWLRAMIREMAA